VRGGFKFGPGGYYPSPHEKRLKSLLTGARAEPQASGMYLITEAKFETLLEDGQREMLVESPQCLYNERGDQAVHSDGPLSVKAAMGNSRSQGMAFAGRRIQLCSFPIAFTRSFIRSCCSASAECAHKQTAPGEKGIEIFSEKFDYAGDNGIGNYRSNVRVKGTDLDMTAAGCSFCCR